LKLKQENSKQSEAHKLVKKCLQAYRDDVENLKVIPEISELLFEAAEVGNIEFLVELIRFDFDILWKIDNHRSIFHIAVEKRHESIFGLLNEIGSIRDLISDSIDKDGNNILHLVAGLAPQDKLNAISGAALQMQRELLWFKEVEKIVNPSYKEMKNGNGKTPYALFAEEHEKLRKQGEEWMMNTAEYSMVVAALIASVMFSVQLADGLDNRIETSTLDLAFAYSNAIALLFSSTSLITFLSILTSRYSYDDFLLSLPVRLMIGVTSLFISITAMMVAFVASFCLKNHNHLKYPLIFVVIGLFACVPISYVLLKYRLCVDIVQSTCYSSSLFQPRQHLLY
ncbi:isoform 2 of ankyrin repeat domain-containing protein 17, partial [Fagus crenata]